MSAFPDWEKYAVSQRRPRSGCIPTGFEILLRAAHVAGIDYDTFQDDFDLDKDHKPNEQPQNNFESVAGAVQRKYPHVKFKRRVFPRGFGADKLKFIEERVGTEQPVLVSISMAAGWHIMPAVDATETEVVFLFHMGMDGSKNVVRLRKADLVSIHDSFDGGDDVAYLDIVSANEASKPSV